jgi:molybdenum cofactor cytidylyltransferase
VTIAAVLLAAGRSTRFGTADKLAAPLGDKPLGHHAAGTLATLPLAARFVVCRPGPHAWPGFERIVNARPEAGLAHSIALGIAAARRGGAEAVLVALADMPFVTAAHLARLLDRHDGPDTLVASSDGHHRMPPALFGARWFDALEELTGDRGARALLDRAKEVVASPEELRDIDTTEDLRRILRRETDWRFPADLP